MRYLKTDRLHCFSPPVMLATFLIEIGLAVYVFWRYSLTTVTRPAITMLVLLAVFQVAEFNICEGSWGMNSLTWAKLGYVAITLLPAVGIHLATRLAGKKHTALVASAYILSASFIGFFLFATQGIAAGACLGNYVIFHQAPGSGMYYGAYYYGMLMVGALYALLQARSMKTRNRARALTSLTVGYLLFMIPTTFVNLVDPSTIQGIPSIMCGFAVIFAVVLSGDVLPQYYRSSSRIYKKRSGIETAPSQ